MRKGWTLEKQNWEDLLKVISDTHWSRTKLNTLYQNKVPERPGVYAICLKLRTINFNQLPFKDLYEIIYVGISENSVRTRFLRHCRKPERGVKEAKECFGDSLEYWYTEVEVEKVFEIESRLIDCFGPPANRRRGRRITAKFGRPQPA